MTHPILAKDHPITRGVKPFEIPDEWYYHMRFPEDMKGVTPILSAIPPDSTRNGRDDPHGGNPVVRAGKGNVEVLSWAFERPDGGRGYGFTGGHYHHNWGNDDYRKLMLNAILWVAKAEVPADGVESTVTPEDLKANLDKKIAEAVPADRRAIPQASLAIKRRGERCLRWRLRVIFYPACRSSRGRPRGRSVYAVCADFSLLSG